MLPNSYIVNTLHPNLGYFGLLQRQWQVGRFCLTHPELPSYSGMSEDWACSWVQHTQDYPLRAGLTTTPSVWNSHGDSWGHGQVMRAGCHGGTDGSSCMRCHAVIWVQIGCQPYCMRGQVSSDSWIEKKNQTIDTWVLGGINKLWERSGYQPFHS